LKLKFQTVAEKTAKNFRGLLYFAAPGTQFQTQAMNIMQLHRFTKRVITRLILNWKLLCCL